jgi:hypothetical protein
MYIHFDEESGVLNMKPRSRQDAERLKRFIKDYGSHGGKMINIETEFDENQPHAYAGYEMHHMPPHYPYPFFEPPFGYNRYPEFRMEGGGSGGGSSGGNSSGGGQGGGSSGGGANSERGERNERGEGGSGAYYYPRPYLVYDSFIMRDPRVPSDPNDRGRR